MKRRKHHHILLLARFSFLASIFDSVRCLPSPARSCRDHYLSGQLTKSILPLSEIPAENDKVFRVECQFPEYSSQSHLSVVTVIHNGLERWYSLNTTEKKTVSYQISDWPYLHSIVAKSNVCVQDLFVQWNERHVDFFNDDSGNDAEFDKPQFTIESLNGNQRSFRKNISFTDELLGDDMDVFHLEGEEAGIAHILPSDSSSSVWIRASPLRCRQSVVERSECLFELITGAESVWIDVKSAVNNIPNSVKTLSFSFRTDSPNTPFFRIKTQSGHLIQVDIIDGYLINVNHIIHPIGLLADGNWHQVNINLQMMAISIDSDTEATSISLRSTTISGENDQTNFDDSMTELTVLLTHAQVTALHFDPRTRGKVKAVVKNAAQPNKQSGDDHHWLCDSKFVRLKNSQTHFFESGQRNFVFGRQICSALETTQNFCNCRGPNSALIPVHVGPNHASCLAENTTNALRLHRLPDKLTFIYIPNFTPKASVSVLFKSDLDNGLLLFGTSTRVNEQQLSSLDGSIAPLEQTTRIQVHFVGKTIFAVMCTRLLDGSERCYSCSIVRPEGFTSNEWIRVSLISYEVYHFMTVNERICHLSPNSAASDASELYKVSNNVQNVLLVGGMYYAKYFQLNRKINDTLRRNFHDNTREKPFSFQGCVAEIRVGGVVQDIHNLFFEQKEIFARNVEDRSTIFGIDESGCEKTCPTACGKAPCKMFSPFGSESESPENELQCDCASIYSLQDNDSENGCMIVKNDDSRPPKTTSTEQLSQEVLGIALSSDHSVKLSVPWEEVNNIHRNAALGLSSNSILNKIWLLLKFPTTATEEPHTIMRIGAIEVKVGKEGRQIIVNIEEYDVSEEFYLTNSHDDQRLHLLAIELNQQFGTAMDRQSLSIRLDYDARIINGFDRIPFLPSSDPIQIIPVVNTDSEDDRTTSNIVRSERDGCLAELSVSFKMRGEDTQIGKAQPLRADESMTKEEDYFSKLIKLAQKDNKYYDSNDFDTIEHSNNLLIYDNYCGIRDDTFWFGNSSHWGSINAYDPLVVNEDYSDPPTSLLSLILTFLLIIILLTVICCYCYMRFRREKDKMNNYFKSNIIKNSTRTISAPFDKCSIGSSDERRPLKSDSSVLESSRTSSTPRSPIVTENGQNPPANELLPTNSEIQGTSMQITTPSQQANYVIVREDLRSTASPSDEFVIDEYSSSPKLAGRRHRSKAAILLRRPPDPPQRPLRIASNSGPTTSNTLPTTAAIAASNAAHTASPLSTSNYSSPYASSSGSAIIAPIASQEEVDY